MKYEMILGCPKCGRFRGKNADRLTKISFKCFGCGFATTRNFKDKFGNPNFKIGQRYLEETVPEAVKRLNLKQGKTNGKN